jgi:excinuclease ABC subunit B
MTESMQRAITETHRRRELQLRYNEEHGITPETIRKAIRLGIEEEIAARKLAESAVTKGQADYVTAEYLEELHAEMLAAAEMLDFERAALLRDRIAQLKGEPVASPQSKPRRGRARRRAAGY